MAKKNETTEPTVEQPKVDNEVEKIKVKKKLKKIKTRFKGIHPRLKKNQTTRRYCESRLKKIS